MDALVGLLDGPRARDAFLLRVMMSPPWSIAIRDQAPISLFSPFQGEAWVTPPGSGDPVRLGPGDVAVARGPDPYVVSDAPDTEPMIVVLPDQVCQTVDGESLSQALDLGVRTWGNDPDGETMMLVGTYPVAGEMGHRLLAAIPPLVTMSSAELDSPVLALLAAEIVRDEPGQEVVLDRLLDLLLVSVLRAWFARPEAAAPGWYSAQTDPIVGKALRLMQNTPEHPWTVERLARETGASRATFARRFQELVGEPPMTFLTDWRLTLAAELLREPHATVGSVARRVGYANPFALSAAFKRERGISPREHRALVVRA
ncbi:MAG: AraC family transcriptional regulator [Candidatus Nanopelagicales bacterium]